VVLESLTTTGTDLCVITWPISRTTLLTWGTPRLIFAAIAAALKPLRRRFAIRTRSASVNRVSGFDRFDFVGALAAASGLLDGATFAARIRRSTLRTVSPGRSSARAISAVPNPRDDISLIVAFSSSESGGRFWFRGFGMIGGSLAAGCCSRIWMSLVIS
jgi:hypothetical protein